MAPSVLIDSYGLMPGHPMVGISAHALDDRNIRSCRRWSENLSQTLDNWNFSLCLRYSQIWNGNRRVDCLGDKECFRNVYVYFTRYEGCHNTDRTGILNPQRKYLMLSSPVCVCEARCFGQVTRIPDNHTKVPQGTSPHRHTEGYRVS